MYAIGDVALDRRAVTQRRVRFRMNGTSPNQRLPPPGVYLRVEDAFKNDITNSAEAFGE